MINRRVAAIIEKDIARKMVILSGPRQCGKTTLAKKLAVKTSAYYNWDIANDRKKMRENKMDLDAKLWIFDELHKQHRWRNWLKGVYDEHSEDHSLLVTGSARLELYGKGGDSLQGRYYQHHLHPFTLAEITKRKDFNWEQIQHLPEKHTVVGQTALEELLEFGGFPEPFLGKSVEEAERWRLNYSERIVQDEVRSLENIQQLDRMELLFDVLPKRVGAVLSINNLREDLECSFHTVKNWIQIFERLYGVFRIYPYGGEKLKAVKKEAKLYLWDWARVENAGARFENLVALHLLRLSHWMEDIHGKKCELRYFRSTVGKEVDFVMLLQGRPWFCVEAKTQDQDLDPGSKYFLERTKVPFAFQISLQGKKDQAVGKINDCTVRLVSAARFLENLP